MYIVGFERRDVILYELNSINIIIMEAENTQQTQVQKTAAQTYAIPFAIVIAGLAIAGAIYFGEGKKAAVAAIGAPKVDPVTSKDHILGNPKAKIMIVEYSDTECPFCKTFQPTIERIMSEYGESGKVALVYRHFPLAFHKKAPKEAEATECAAKLGGNTKFWEYLKKVFETTNGNDSLDPAELPKIAGAVGLDVTVFNKCLNDGETKALVDEDIASGGKAGVSGTPYSIVLMDGEVVGAIEGAQPYENVKAGIDELLK